MTEILYNRKQLLIAAMAASLLAGGCLGSGPKIHVQREKPPKAAKTAKDEKPAKPGKPGKAPTSGTEDTTASAEPDKVLYDRSMLDIKKGHYTEARLSLQALINTYPDSEYLAKAKLAVADSFYKEGGTSNLTQAVEEYKNFDVFFPFLDEAAYAQMQVGMAHYRMMEKSDRDSTNMQAAEDDFQTFLLKYPQSPLAPQAEQHLREVQEVLADGEYKIARFYYIKQDYPASAARLVELVDRYPLYSQSDDALWMLGSVYDRAKQVSKNEDAKNHWADLAGKCYDRIVEDYPLSPYVKEAKSRLAAMGMPVPASDPNALARMQKQQMYEKGHHQLALVKFPLGMLHSGPDVSAAARSGAPNLNPPTDTVSATDILKPGAEGPTFSMGAQPTTDANNADAGGGGAPVEAVQGGSPDTAPTTGVGVQIIAAPPNDAAAAANNSAPPATAAPPVANPPTTNSAAGSSGDSGVPVLTPTATSGAANNSTPATAPGASATPPAAATPAGSQPQAPAASTPAGTQPQPAATSNTAPKSESKTDPKNESTSKKKKGLKKLIPW